MKKTLIIRMSAMGDVAMVAPVLEYVVKQNPDERFVVLTSNRLDAFFSHIANVECICATKDNTEGLVSIFKFFLYIIRTYNIGRVVDLHGVIRSRILSYFFRLKGIPVYSIDKNREQKKSIINREISKEVRLPKVIQYYAKALRQSGLKLEFEDRLDLQIRDISHLDNIYKRRGAADRIIGLAPFAQHKGKLLHEDKIEELVAALLRDKNNRIFIFGGSDQEKEICDRVCRGKERVTSVVRALSLSDELSFISNLDIMVSMDSAAQHMASLVGMRAVTIWGATHPSLGYLGFGQSYDDCVVANIGCSPCSIYGNKPCVRESFLYECLHTASIEKVVALVEIDR